MAPRSLAASVEDAIACDLGKSGAGSKTGGAGGQGVAEKILSHDPGTGDVTRLLRFDAGVETSETITHDFWEEVWILEGALVDLGKKQIIELGRSLGVDYAMTTSCYDPASDGTACGSCDACQLRKKGFHEGQFL